MLRRWAAYAAGAVIIGTAGVPLLAADHRDAPAVKADATVDITDVYAFVSPANPTNTVLIMNVNPLMPPGEFHEFSNTATYNFNDDINEDFAKDAVISVTFDDDATGGAGQQVMTVALNDVVLGSGPTSVGNRVNVVTAGPITAFAGMRDDPFFLDLPALKGLLDVVAGASPAPPVYPLPTPNDTFDGTNVSSIVLELPTSALFPSGAGDSVNLWASVVDGGVQVDRMAIPALNTIFIDPVDAGVPAQDAMNDAYNATAPEADLANWSDEFNGVLVALGTLLALPDCDQATDPAVLALAGDTSTTPDTPGVLLPDVVAYNPTGGATFATLDGRTPSEDAERIALGAILDTCGADLATIGALNDGVTYDDKFLSAAPDAFPDTFPYLSAPNGVFFDPVADFCNPAPASPFTDVATHFSKTFVDCLYATGLTSGKTATSFAPDDLTTRGEFAVMAIRALERFGFVPLAGDDPFTDTTGHFAEDEITQLYLRNIVAGTSATTFEPNRQITRGELAIMAASWYEEVIGLDAVIPTTPFTDIDGHFAEDDIARLYGLGIVTGRTSTTFVPNGTATRGEIAVIMVNVLEAAAEQPVHLHATLLGSEEVPPTGDPDGTGAANVTLNPHTGELCYALAYSGIAAPTAAHIHTGADGVAGPILITLFMGSPVDSACRVLSGAELAGVPGIIANPAGFYVNIHTGDHPAGAIRGQLTEH